MADGEDGVELWGWDRFLTELQSFITSADREIDTASPSFAHFVVERLEICIRALSAIILTIRDEEALRDIRIGAMEVKDTCKLLRHEMWRSKIDDIDSHSCNYVTPTVQRNSRGRPSFIISKEQLEYLRSLNFSWTQIAELLNVSRATVYRRRRELDILDTEVEMSIADNDLQLLIQRLRQQMPNMGESLVMGHIRSLGYGVCRQRVRRAIHLTDPLNTSLRWEGILISRRPYSVPSPNSLWHIDGHHKLIRWGMVTHGGIDGYSRLVVYLKCSDNNRAETVYNLFLCATRKYNLPSRVRSDHGRENYLVATHMLETRGYERNSMITGSSVHNQRIERLWRDMHRCVTVVFYKLFYYLEYQNYLNPANPFHLFALQYVYLPRINKSLQLFADGWNSHGIRTEHHLSPHQLFIQGALKMQRRGLQALDFFEEVDNLYGIDEDAHAIEQDGDYTVQVQPFTLPLAEEQLAQLQLRVDPLAESEQFGIELYIETLNFLRQVVSTSTV